MSELISDDQGILTRLLDQIASPSAHLRSIKVHRR